MLADLEWIGAYGVLREIHVEGSAEQIDLDEDPLAERLEEVEVPDFAAR